MRILKNTISFITAAAMCCALGGSVRANAVYENSDDFSKISDTLLEEFGVPRQALTSAKSRKHVCSSNEQTVPVIIWTANDIDHKAVEEQALPILRADLECKQVKGLLSVENLTTLNDVLAYGPELSKDAVQNYIKKERAESRSMYTELNGEFVSTYLSDADVYFVSQYSPVILASLSLNDVLNLSESKDVLELDFDKCSKKCEEKDPLDVSTVSTKAIKVANQIGYGYNGYGIKIGMVEYALPDVTNVQLAPIASNIHLSNNQNNYIGSHATFDACVMVGRAANGYSRGMAPYAQLYAATCNDFGGGDCPGNDYGAIEWLLTQGVNVINASHAVGHYDDYNVYNIYAQWLDHIAKEHYVTFVQSSGNEGSAGVISGGMAYNIITVGAIDDHNTPSVGNDTLWYGSTGSSAYYNGTGLAYKPDLCAPGANILNSASQQPSGSSGTSASAPHVTGAIALLFEANSYTMLEPAMVKALVTAGVSLETIHRYRPDDTNYRQYGAGLLDAFNAVTSSKYNQCEAGILPHNNIYYDTYPLPISTTGKTIRVSMAFLKNEYVHTANQAQPIQNLTLSIWAPNGTQVISSGSSNNVQIVEFTAATTGQYTIKVSRIPGAYQQPVEYGIAWMEMN